MSRLVHNLVRTGFLARVGVIAALITPASAYASYCANAWDGDKVASVIAGRPSHLSVPLRDRQQRITEVTVDQILAFSEAKERIYRAAGLSPKFIICDGGQPNAFATAVQNSDIVGVTAGMLRLVNGDRDMAATVIGHELAHHTQGHMTNAVVRDALIGLAGIVLGAAVDSRQQRRSGVYTGMGIRLGQIGATLVSRKFNRDQEREADSIGFNYLVTAGFDPNGAVRLAEKLKELGGGVGLFFDSHPGWAERSDRFREMIASNPHAQQLIAMNSSAIAIASLVPVEPPQTKPTGQEGVEIFRQVSGQSPIASSKALQPNTEPQVRASIENSAYPDMMTAVMASDKVAVSNFLDLGRDVNERRNGVTYLIAAVINNDLDMVRLLVSKGADVNQVDSRGFSPIVYSHSIRPANMALTQFLEKSGAVSPYSASR